MSLDDTKIESAIEDLAVDVAQSQGTSLWKHYLPQHLHLRLAKEVVNYTAPKLNRLVPHVTPHYPVSKLINRVFGSFEHMATEQRRHGTLDNNFISMIRATRRFLLYVCEHDIYYRRWMHIFMLTLYMEVKQMLPDLAVVKTIKPNQQKEET